LRGWGILIILGSSVIIIQSNNYCTYVKAIQDNIKLNANPCQGTNGTIEIRASQIVLVKIYVNGYIDNSRMNRESSSLFRIFVFNFLQQNRLKDEQILPLMDFKTRCLTMIGPILDLLYLLLNISSCLFRKDENFLQF